MALGLRVKRLTEKNHREVLARAKHKTMRQVERLVAEIAPRPDEPARIRALPRPRELVFGLADGHDTASPNEPGPELGSAPDLHAEQRPRHGSERPIPRQRRAEVIPLSPRRYKLVMTVSEETHDKLRRLQDLLSHQVPDGDPAVITDKAFDLLLETALKQKAAHTRSTTSSSAAKLTINTKQESNTASDSWTTSEDAARLLPAFAKSAQSTDGCPGIAGTLSAGTSIFQERGGAAQMSPAL